MAGYNDQDKNMIVICVVRKLMESIPFQRCAGKPLRNWPQRATGTVIEEEIIYWLNGETVIALLQW